MYKNNELDWALLLAKIISLAKAQRKESWFSSVFTEHLQKEGCFKRHFETFPKSLKEESFYITQMQKNMQTSQSLRRHSLRQTVKTVVS